MKKINKESIKKSLDFIGGNKEKEKDETEMLISRTQQLALKALEKEMKVEDSIEKEEDEKEKVLDDEVNQKLLEIKQRKDLIAKALNQKKTGGHFRK